MLDVGSGGGDTALLLAGLVGPAGAVVGVDASVTAVAAAGARLAAAGMANVLFRLGDPAAMRFEQPFDAVAGRYVLMFQPDPAAMLAGVVRHLRPGGVVVFHEPDCEGARCSPPVAAFDRVSAWNALRARGVGRRPEARRPAGCGLRRRRLARADVADRSDDRGRRGGGGRGSPGHRPRRDAPARAGAPGAGRRPGRATSPRWPTRSWRRSVRTVRSSAADEVGGWTRRVRGKCRLLLPGACEPRLDRQRPRDFRFRFCYCLRGERHRSTVVVGNCTVRADNGGILPGESITPLHVRRSCFGPICPQRGILVEPPGTAPGSDPLITRAFITIVPRTGRRNIVRPAPVQRGNAAPSHADARDGGAVGVGSAV